MLSLEQIDDILFDVCELFSSPPEKASISQWYCWHQNIYFDISVSESIFLYSIDRFVLLYYKIRMIGLGKIDTSQIKNQVYEQCKRMIVQGKWLPGSKLPSESQLCEQLGVSRVSVRSALQFLAAQGYIEIKRGEGSFVNNFNLNEQLGLLMPMIALDEKDHMEVLQYRLILEPNIMPMVIDKITEEDLVGLEKSFHEMEHATDDIVRFMNYDSSFHIRLIEISGNNTILKVHMVLFEIFYSSWQEIGAQLGYKDGLAYHKKIIEALRSRDKELARTLMYEHVERTVTRMAKYYSTKKLDD